MVNHYSKLVRDKIPEIIIQQGAFPKTELLNDADYFNALNQKLTEEVSEYLENYDISELADIIEVIYALLKYKGVALSDFENLRLQKHSERGGFDSRILLIEIEHSE